MRSARTGTSLIDLVISIAIVTVLFGGVYLVYFSIETAIANVSVRSAATNVVENEIEIIRNLPYGSVGTVSGIPSGVIPQTQTITYGNFSFVVNTTVLNIDDPFDSSPSSSPVVDYKLVDVEATCPFCQNFAPVEITTTVASRNLTAGTPYGSIFVNAIDADGIGVPEASVEVVNASVTPSIDVIDTTNASGVLELIGVPTSTQGYQIFVSKSGYSSAQTYPQGAAGNPNPVSPNITVASGTVSSVTLSIDTVASVTVSTTDMVCVPIASVPISIQGTKVIGTSPNVLKFSTTTKTNASGSFALPMEWDTYTFSMTSSSQDVAGTIPEDPLTIDPGAMQNFQFVLAPASDPSLLVGAYDATTGAGILGASITVSKGGFSETETTDHASFMQTNWAGQGLAGYSSESGGIDATDIPGELTLVVNASGTYSTSTTESLTSNTFDVGGTSSTFNALSWNPGAEPANTTVTFQVAANNDNATWNFIGPDGTANTYFMASSTLPAALSGKRYFRYEVFMSTQDLNTAPVLSSVSLDYTANCVPPAQSLFTGLATGNYTVDITAPNYAENSTTVSVAAGEQSTMVNLTEL